MRIAGTSKAGKRVAKSSWRQRAVGVNTEVKNLAVFLPVGDLITACYRSVHRYVAVTCSNYPVHWVVLCGFL